ncbi:MAG: hypothetical protein HYX22_01795 [Candidatus Yanofskybacteria bacterium]|nr:hypothetical protein [Candidatus Yanofskybacteria bacterium]
MFEGGSIEKFEKHETPKPETGPEIDIESVLERGEIERVEPLEGYEHIDVVEIKDDGKGLFKTNSEMVYMSGGKERLPENRIALERLAYAIDKILGFNLVPATVSREISGQMGALQEFVSTAIPAIQFNWEGKVKLGELIRAAVFDYLIDAQDRDTRNFLVNLESGKIWLIDHDYYMFLDVPFVGSRLVDEARRRKLTILPTEILTAVTKLAESVDTLIVEGEEDYLKQILAGIKERAGILLKTGEIPKTI